MDRLNLHKNQHLRENPELVPDAHKQCQYCEKRFASLQYLKVHERKHREDYLNCELCD